MRGNTDRMLAMIDHAVAGSAAFLPVRLIAFPEFAHAAPVYAGAHELAEKLAVPIPNEHTDRIVRKACEHGVYIQSGSMIERDDDGEPGGVAAGAIPQRRDAERHHRFRDAVGRQHQPEQASHHAHVEQLRRDERMIM